MTITEFLLARIAEDEAQSHNVLVFRMNPRTNMPGNQAIPARVLAECAAKRAIVAELTGGPVHTNPTGIMTRILRALVAVYAGHPDYRPEWAL